MLIQFVVKETVNILPKWVAQRHGSRLKIFEVTGSPEAHWEMQFV